MPIDALRRHGLLLAADPVLPSVATLVAGEPVRGSWWAHPKSHAIFAALGALTRHADAIAIPLIAGKVTFIHRRLWPAVLTIGIAREPWQTAKLSPRARALLKRLEKTGALEASGDDVRELEGRLLVRTEQIHTDRGSHAKIVERWDRWARRMSVKPMKDPAEARAIIERSAAALTSGARVRLPWPSTPSTRLRPGR